MESLQQTIALWVSILESAVRLSQTIHADSLKTILSACALSFATLLAVQVQRSQFITNVNGISLGNRSLDSLNAANLNRRVTGNLFIHDAHHTVVIKGEDASLIWNYTGYATEAQVSTIEFSIDSDSNVPFEMLDCFAHDLRSDPGLRHRIRPFLIGQDGASKKIAVPFLNSISAGERFAVRLECQLPGCMRSSVEYYTSTLSFDQPFIPTCTVQLRFIGEKPEWVRFYQLGSKSELKLIKDLPLVSEMNGLAEYSNVSWSLKGRSTAVYAFQRGEPKPQMGTSQRS